MDFNKINLLFILVVCSMFDIGYLYISKPPSKSEQRPFCKFPYDVGHYPKLKLETLEQKRFWFSKEENNCVPFDYKGCGGNGNNFKTYEECMKTCNTTTFTLRYMPNLLDKLNSLNDFIYSLIY